MTKRQPSDELEIVAFLRRGHAQPCECVECEAAALISELCATIDAVQNELLACRAIACNSRIDAMLTAALSRAKGEK